MRWGELSYESIHLLKRICTKIKYKDVFEVSPFIKENDFWKVTFVNIVASLTLLFTVGSILYSVYANAESDKLIKDISTEYGEQLEKMNDKKIQYYAYVGSLGENLANVISNGKVQAKGVVLYQTNIIPRGGGKCLYLVWRAALNEGVSPDDVRKKYSKNSFKIDVSYIRNNSSQIPKKICIVGKNDLNNLYESDGEVILRVHNSTIQKTLEKVIASAAQYPEFELKVVKL
ncbi:hypothetical protein [Maridesulfovibrio sp.]|uniref:hypothetical protein n=1 Tax=Maridesulfovibrio sp. TaxID=2795000 RepID=UPI0039EEFF06